MTWQELNEVRTLRKRISIEQKNLKALRDSATSINSNVFGADNIKSQNHKSRVEILTALIVDTEKEIEILQKRLVDAVPTLTEKLQATLSDRTEQTLMIYRYVACKFFRDIGFEMGYSENWVYWKHRQILKKIRVD